MAVTHRQTVEFDERNLFLQVLLGLLALGEHLGVALDREAPERAADADEYDAPATPSPPLLLVLGAIAASDHLRLRVAAALPAVPEDRPVQQASSSQLAPDALRRWLT